MGRPSPNECAAGRLREGPWPQVMAQRNGVEKPCFSRVTWDIPANRLMGLNFPECKYPPSPCMYPEFCQLPFPSFQHSTRTTWGPASSEHQFPHRSTDSTPGTFHAHFRTHASWLLTDRNSFQLIPLGCLPASSSSTSEDWATGPR